MIVIRSILQKRYYTKYILNCIIYLLKKVVIRRTLEMKYLLKSPNVEKFIKTRRLYSYEQEEVE